jgi:glycosyltransferase involved in cell wall biosynthesis
MKPSISIIIPAYNAEETLAATLESCLHQTFQPQEIMVIDNGSHDATAKIAASFGSQIQYFFTKNEGVSRARNIGAERAVGEWLLFLDADDQLLPHTLEILLATAEKQEAKVVYGMVIERREPPQLARLNGFDFAAGLPPHGAERNFWRCAIATPGSALVNKSLHHEVGGFVTGYEPMEDRDYWIKCGLLEKIAFCNMVVLDKIWRPSSHGSQHSKRIYRGQLAQQALRKWALDRGVMTKWIPHDQTIIKSALDEAVWRRSYDILKPLLQEAKVVGVFHWKAALLAALFSKPLPPWIDG